MLRLEELSKIPKCNSKSFGEHRFSPIATSVWNSLPASVRNLPILSEFKTQLKTFLFPQAFSQTWVDHSCDHRLPVRLHVYDWCMLAHWVFGLQQVLCSRTAIHYYNFYYLLNDRKMLQLPKCILNFNISNDHSREKNNNNKTCKTTTQINQLTFLPCTANQTGCCLEPWNLWSMPAVERMPNCRQWRWNQRPAPSETMDTCYHDN